MHYIDYLPTGSHCRTTNIRIIGPDKNYTSAEANKDKLTPTPLQYQKAITPQEKNRETQEGKHTKQIIHTQNMTIT